MLCHTLQQHYCSLEERIAADLRLSNMDDIVIIDFLVDVAGYKLLHRMERHCNLVVAGVFTGQYLREEGGAGVHCQCLA